MESLVLSPGGSQPRLNTWPNCSFSLSQEWSLSQTVWNFLVSSNEVISLRDPTRPPKKDEIILFLVPAAFCLQKPSISYSSSEFFLLARWDEAQFLNGWRTPVLSLSVEFCFYIFFFCHFFLFFIFFKFYFIFKLYIIVLVLPNIKMSFVFKYHTATENATRASKADSGLCFSGHSAYF